jgi:hypothetical protein
MSCGIDAGCGECWGRRQGCLLEVRDYSDSFVGVCWS